MVLFTDIVASTGHATRLGDRRWRDLVSEHHRLIRHELARFRGPGDRQRRRRLPGRLRQPSVGAARRPVDRSRRTAAGNPGTRRRSRRRVGSLANLADLLDPVAGAALLGFPDPQASALRAALGWAVAEMPFGETVLERALVAVMRGLAQTGVLVAVDDEQPGPMPCHSRNRREPAAGQCSKAASGDIGLTSRSVLSCDQDAGRAGCPADGPLTPADGAC